MQLLTDATNPDTVYGDGRREPIIIQLSISIILDSADRINRIFLIFRHLKFDSPAHQKSMEAGPSAEGEWKKKRGKKAFRPGQKE
ncbi:hypothetical protein [Paenibacillus hamazuiensis]|uniref:hypothetical protein n=1 Tax=Paenibacillus hamazuiensis TaxID=2936508 RepID=UPI00200E3308|nr:hypothetical protein [Paenibacillus hamazuiensis]